MDNLLAPEINLPPGYEDAKQLVYDKENDPPLQIYGFDDLSNAQRFEWRYGGKFIFTQATGWLAYEKGRWHRDKTRKAQQAMLNTLNLIGQEADLVEGDDEKATEARKAILSWAKACRGLALFNSAMKFSEHLACFVRDYEIFDRRPELFLCANGTLNLNTGEFGPFDPEHLLTKGSNVVYDPLASCPKWEKFLSDVQGGKEHMVCYLARAVGYTMTTDTGGQCLFVPYGTGGTGKSQFLNVLRGIMGGYSFDADSEMFMSKRGDSGQPFEMAGLEGKRALFAVETESGKELACAKVKRMTGQDPIRASYKCRDHYTITPHFKVWFATNDRPKLDATDDAMWDRPKLIPFDVKFRDQPNEIKNIADMLLAQEASGILNWMIQGHVEWKAQGLNHPDEVKYAVQEWRGDEDYLGRWLGEVTQPTTNQHEYVTKAELFQMFSAWTVASKEGESTSDKQFSRMMKRKGFVDKVVKVNGKTPRVWLGLKYVGSFGKGYSPDVAFIPSPEDIK